MSKIENNQVSRVLRDDELALVSGGYHEVDELGARGFMNPALIRGFNPQPDPPDMKLVG
jgi:hypothetical protein